MSSPASRSSGFRCSIAAESRDDDLAGTATHVHAFLLVEHHGPWGTSAPRESRLPEAVKKHLGRHGNIRVLMMRRHRRALRGALFHVFLCFPAESLLLASHVENYDELLEVDLDSVSQGAAPDWPVMPGPLFGVCTHGRHDVCCAERGRPVAAALSTSHPEQTWEISHMGGDRFAANMIAFPEGLYYGRMEPGCADEVALAHEQGRLDLEHLRGRSSHPMPVQYAEIALRRHLQEDRIDAVRLARRDGARMVFQHGADQWVVQVRRKTEGAVQLTCAAERLNPAPVFEVASLERL